MIELNAIERSFMVGDKRIAALQNINLQIDAGAYVSLMGPSGSGKSTLLNILGLLDQANAGEYLFNGQPTSQLDDRQRTRLRLQEIGFVFQSFHLIARLTTAENIELPMMLAGIEPAIRQQHVSRLIEQFNLGERQHHHPEELSGGQRQRVAIARAVIMQPSLLLADEPTGNLDQQTGLQVIQTLEALNNQGTTLIIVTHDPLIGQRAKQRLYLSDGKIQTSAANDHAPD